MWHPITVVAVPIVAAAVDAGAGGFDPWTLIGTAVTPTLVVILFLMGKLHTHAEVEELRRDRDLARTELATLQTGLVERAIPALTRTTLVLENISPLLQTDVHLRPPPSG